MSKILFFSDLHQNISWASKILNKELYNIDKIIIGGDYFDTHFKDKVSTVKETCLFLEKIWSELGDKVIFLRGNHDQPLFYLYQKAKLHKTLNLPDRLYCSGFSKSSAYHVAKHLSWEFIENTKLIHFEDNVIYSHAGARPELFKYINGKFDVNGFLNEADRLNKVWRFELDHPFFNIGPCRGGRDLFGGLTWCDMKEHYSYNSEEIPLQVIGHSSLTKYKKHGNIYCVDCKQSGYAIVEDGQVEYKEI